MITTRHDKVAQKLKKKNWKKHHISKTVSILKKGEKEKAPNIKRLDKILHWIVLLLVLFGNMIIPIGLIPVIVEMPQSVVILVISTMGLAFGLLIDNLIREIDSISAKHYFFGGILIPVIASISIVVILQSVKTIAVAVGLTVSSNPLLVSLFYVLSFSLPHLIYKIKSKEDIFY